MRAIKLLAMFMALSLTGCATCERSENMHDACTIVGVVAIVAVGAVVANHEIKPAGVQNGKW